MSAGRTVRAALTPMLALSLALVGPGTSPALAQAAAPDLDRGLEQFEHVRDGLARLEASLPDEHWTQEDLAFELAFEEPEAISAWVQERIAYQPYRGLLRGPDGTLQSRAGNALDQSVLLAGLLFDAGYTARVATATVDEDAATELVAGMRPPDFGSEGSPNAIDGYMEAAEGDPDALDALREEAEARAATRRDAVREEAAWLRSVLGDAGIGLSGEELAVVVDEAREYAWVQYRLGDDDAWSAAHPAAPADASWLAELEPDDTLTGDVPADLQHRFRFQAVVERRLGSDLETQAITDAWERPVANMTGRAFDYASVPDGFLTTDLAEDDEAAAHAATDFILPLFDGALAPGGQYFDTLGSVVPPMAGDDQAAGVFGSLAGALADATSEVSGEEDAVALTAHWLEFTFIEPGGQETTHRRMIVDRLGEERRRSGDASGPLEPMTDEELLTTMQATHTFMVAPGHYPAAYVNERSLTGLRGMYDFMEHMFVVTAEGDENASLPDEIDVDPQELRLLRAFLAFDDDPVLAGEGAMSYRATPSLAVVTTAWDGTSGRTDIVHNARRSFAPAEGGGVPAAQPEAALLNGVWESAIEGLLLGNVDRTNDTLAFFDAVRQEGVPVYVLSPDDPEGLAAMELPEPSEEAIRRDLDRGYAVVAAGTMPAGPAEAAWWRVHPTTGETLGRGGDGRGQDMAEYSSAPLSGTGVLISVIAGVAGFTLCKGNGGATGCCLADAASGAAIGLGVGIALAFTYVTASTSLFVGIGVDAIGVGAGFAGVLGAPIPTWCSSGGGGAGRSVDRPVAATPCPMAPAFAALVADHRRDRASPGVAPTVRFA